MIRLTQKVYRDWSSQFAAKFGLNHDAGIEMLASWYTDLNERGVSLEELIEIERRLTENPPERREHYRGAVFGSISRIRHERLRAEQSHGLIHRGEREKPMPGASIRELLLERGLLTQKYRRQAGLLAEQQSEPETTPF